MRPLYFRLAGVPVRVEPSFALMAVLLGFGGRSLLLLAVWVVVVFVSILAHELGHAAAFRAFGRSPQITLHAFGGLTGASGSLSPGRDVVVSVAGPLAGFALGFAVWALSRAVAVPPGGLVGFVALSDLLFVNIAWGVLNLVPILPLDGGRTMASLFDLVTRGNGERPALVVSIAVGGLGALAALAAGQLWIAFLCGIFTAGNVSSLSALRRRSRDQDVLLRLEQGRHGLRTGQPDATVAAASAVLDAEPRAELRARAAEQLVAAHLAAGRVDDAGRAIECFPAEVPPSTRLRAQLAEAQGRPQEALELLRQAFDLRPDDDSGANLADGLARSGRVDDAVAILHGAHAADVGPRTAHAVMAALRASGRDEEAAAAGGQRWKTHRNPVVAYDVARAQASAGRPDDALRWLARAVDGGFSDVERLDGDPDLQALHGDPRWERIRRRLG